jgi:hypothetical protein
MLVPSAESPGKAPVGSYITERKRYSLACQIAKS